MFQTLSGWVQLFLNITQTVAAIGVMVITLLYLIVTKKIFDQNHPTFIAVTDISRDIDGLTLTAENHGTATALNVSISVRTTGRTWHPMEGKRMIVPGEKQVYRAMIDSLPDGTRLKVLYRNQNRGTRREMWRMSGGEMIFLGKA